VSAMMPAAAAPTNAMSIDVEDYFHVNAFAKIIDRAGWDKYERRVARNTRRVMELYADAGVKATFFVLGWVAEREPQLIKDIAAAGHEVACHGMTHQLVYNQDPQTFRQETAASKQRLEDLIGAKVRGYRAASYSITRASMWAIDILEELNFEYDSSIFPIRHDTYGVPDAPRFSYRIGSGKLLEVPLTTVEVAGARLPCSGGGYFRLLPYALFRWALQRVNSHDRQPGVFYFHPWEIDPEQPRIPGASWKSNFRHYTNLAATESRLKQLLRDFKWDRMDRVFGIAQ
jgi:polysaccharide deacetylase family protein (PEP-CTERM system associated)